MAKWLLKHYEKYSIKRIRIMAEKIDKKITSITAVIELENGEEQSEVFVREKDAKVLNQTLEKLTQSIEALQKDLKDEKENYEKSKKELKESHEKDFQNYRQEVEAMDKTKQKLEADKANLEAQLKEKNAHFAKQEQDFQNKLEEKQKALNLKDEELKSLKNASSELKTQLSKQRQDYENLNAKLQDLKEQSNESLYEFYKSLEDDFKTRFSFIKAQTLMGFNATCGAREILSKLYQVIESEKKDYQIELFERLFALHEKLYGCERLNTKEGDEFNIKEHRNINGTKAQGKIIKVFFQGFKDGKEIKPSLVEL